MFRNRKSITTLVIAGLLCTLGLAACSDNKDKNASVTNTPQSSNSSEARVKMKMFMGDSGLPHAKGVDPSNNPFINIVKDYANVDLELEVPSYQDFKTKFDLLLSSGQLPDLVHTWFPDETYQRADEGAFLDLKKFYDKSVNVKKVITPEMMELAKSPSGHYYRIPMSMTTAPQGSGVAVRYDLVKKYNNGVWPESVEAWVALMRKIHAAEPNAIVLSNRIKNDNALAFGGLPIFSWFGALPYSYRVQDGKVYSTFQLPEYRAAVEVMKTLYSEGILDKEFATNDLAKWAENKKNKNVLMEYNTADQYLPSAPVPEELGKDWQFAPPLKQYPAVLKNSKYAMPMRNMSISAHGIYISSKTKDPERAWKVIEGFASDALHEAIFWGKAGEDYTVANGKKIPNKGKGLDSPDYWKIHLGLIFGFSDQKEWNIASAEQSMDKDQFARRTEGLKMLEDQANKNGLPLSAFVKWSDAATNKISEAKQFISQATFEAIMNRTSMEQFDKKVEEYTKKYGFIYDEYTKYLNDHKDELKKNGVVEAEW